MHSITAFDALSSCIDNLTVLRVQLTDFQNELTRLGLTDERPARYGGRYLYMVGPLIKGTRARRYVGAKPERQREALAPFVRTLKYQAYGRALEEVNRSLEELNEATLALVARHQNAATMVKQTLEKDLRDADSRNNI